MENITNLNNIFTVDVTKVAGVGDANMLEVQKALGASHREIENMRFDANKINSDGVDVKA